MLASCAPGIAVVNIDNGYGAACAALRVLQLTRETQAMERRDFLRASAAGAAAGAAAAAGIAAAALTPAEAADLVTPATATTEQGGMRYRMLGRTGQRVSLVGLGGFHLAKPGPEAPSEADAIRIVRTGLDAGINFCDNCWDYNGGESERRLGLRAAGWLPPARLPDDQDRRPHGDRRHGPARDLAAAAADRPPRPACSSTRSSAWTTPSACSPHGGAMEAMLRAREQGKVRFIGFTGHKSPAIHAHMFETADRHGFRFDTRRRCRSTSWTRTTTASCTA